MPLDQFIKSYLEDVERYQTEVGRYRSLQDWLKRHCRMY